MTGVAVVGLSFVVSFTAVVGVLCAATAANAPGWDRRTLACWAGVVLCGTAVLSSTLGLAWVLS